MLVIFDLEPYEERYCAQMRFWMHDTLVERNIEHIFITPYSESTGKLDVLTNKIEHGTVLDAIGTSYYKSKQLAWFLGLLKDGEIKSGDKLLFFDVQFAIEWVRYALDLSGVKCEIYAIVHAGSYTKGDFTQQLGTWFNLSEHAWLNCCDGLFVGTYYHKDSIISRLNRKDLEDKIHVTGNIFDTKSIRDMVTFPPEKKYDIVFSNRWDIEKNSGDFVTMLELLQNKLGLYNYNKAQDNYDKQVAIRTDMERINVCITTSREKLDLGTDKVSLERLHLLEDLRYYKCFSVHVDIRENLTKQEYYQLVADSKVFVTTSQEENFGYCLAEAMALGCHPIAPNCASHPELLSYTNEYLYADLPDAVGKIVTALKDPMPCVDKIKLYDGSAERMIDIMFPQNEESPWN